MNGQTSENKYMVAEKCRPAGSNLGLFQPVKRPKMPKFKSVNMSSCSPTDRTCFQVFLMMGVFLPFQSVSVRVETPLFAERGVKPSSMVSMW